jgi:uncharacterized RDD family membrane protein YckC
MSAVLAYLSVTAPAHQMPMDYSAITARSLPLAVVWAALVIAAVFLFSKRSLWLMIGAPVALYWPIWLLVHGYPPCWYMGNCI